MNKNSLIEASLFPLRELLAREFGASAPDFASQVKAAVPRLPDDLAQILAKLENTETILRKEAEPLPEGLADFGFRCGQVYEKLMAHRQMQMELENVVVGPDSVSAAPLQASQIEPLARFVEVRDRVFRKVADFTLKALLIGLGLLTLGLVLGLV
jgi:hypothetical protein